MRREISLLLAFVMSPFRSQIMETYKKSAAG